MATKKSSINELNKSAASVQAAWEEYHEAIAAYQEALEMSGVSHFPDFPPEMAGSGSTPFEGFHYRGGPHIPYLLAKHTHNTMSDQLMAMHQGYMISTGPVSDPWNAFGGYVIPGGAIWHHLGFDAQPVVKKAKKKAKKAKKAAKKKAKKK